MLAEEVRTFWLRAEKAWGIAAFKYLKISGRWTHSAWSQGTDPGLEDENNHKICLNIS